MIPISTVALPEGTEETVVEALRSGQVAQGPLVAEFETGFAALTGVPHAVLEVPDPAETPVVELGRAIREHPRFMPEGTNVDFVRVIDGNTIELRTYERGVEDETLACGTGAVAAALVMAALGRVKPPVAARTRGGWTLTIDFFMSDLGFCDVSLTGDARIVYRGEIRQSDDSSDR